jgi:predicted xylose isomerase-like sugar epimerase
MSALITQVPTSAIKSQGWTNRQKQIRRAKAQFDRLLAIQITVINMLESINQNRACITAKNHGINLLLLKSSVAALYLMPSNQADKAGIQKELHEAIGTIMPLLNQSEEDFIALENCASCLFALEQLTDYARALTVWSSLY